MPPRVTLQWQLDIATDLFPERLHESGISDHAPAIVTARPRRATPTEQQAISQFIFDDPEFVMVYDSVRLYRGV
eukprot:4446425-Pyramimonas_sp.AAC.1